jgi:hypothetical protein
MRLAACKTRFMPGLVMFASPRRLLSLAAALLAASFGTPAAAANECRVSVGFHDGANPARREQMVTLVLSVGDVLPGSIARLAFVRNEGPHDVRLVFDGLPPLQLMRGQADPKLGSFATEVALKSVECLPAKTVTPLFMGFDWQAAVPRICHGAQSPVSQPPDRWSKA